MRLLSIPLKPKGDAGRARLAAALQTIAAEDPALHFDTDPATGETIVHGTGELHLEIVLDRLAREFAVEAAVGRPTVAYKEALTCQADGEMKYAVRSGGRGVYAHAKVHVAPGQPGSGYIFVNHLIESTIPTEFIRPMDEGIKDALQRGVLAGYPIDDVEVEVYDASYHDLDSSQEAFRIAAALAFQDAAKKAAPVLLEPIMRVEVSAPGEFAKEVIDGLLSRRGQLQARQDRGGAHVVVARVPLSELFGYATDLRSRTLGRGTFEATFDAYEPVAAEGGADESVVGARRPRVPPSRDSRIALPEPSAGEVDD